MRRELRSPDPLPGGGARPDPLKEPPPPKIQAFENKFSASSRRHEDSWNRTPNQTGQGAIHVRSFHCKLNDEALALMDSQINDWLDEHPQYEVKMVTTTIGTWLSKTSELRLIVNVWV